MALPQSRQRDGVIPYMVRAPKGGHGPDTAQYGIACRPVRERGGREGPRASTSFDPSIGSLM